ncbi:ribonuclease domain-containing protein [Petrachloros mirabilis]
MQRRWTSLFLILVALMAVVPLGFPTWASCSYAVDSAAQQQTAQPTIGDGRPSDKNKSIQQTAPQKAYDLLARLQDRHGIPLPGYVGGREFHNRERRLPRGRYREYDVNRKVPGRSRDGERLVIEQDSGKAYYTGDHYQTFIPLN